MMEMRQIMPKRQKSGYQNEIKIDFYRHPGLKEFVISKASHKCWRGPPLFQSYMRYRSKEYISQAVYTHVIRPC